MKSTTVARISLSGLLGLMLALVLTSAALAEDQAAGAAAPVPAPKDAAAPSVAPAAAPAAAGPEGEMEETAGPSDWGLTLGIRGGGIHHDIVDQFKATAPLVSPILDLRYKDVSLGFTFLWAHLAADTSMTIANPDPASQPIIPKFTFDSHGEDTRMDFDVSLKYAVNKYITPFVGYRHELFYNTQITFKRTSPTDAQILEIFERLHIPPDQQREILARLAAEAPKNFDENINIDFAAFGAALQYPLDFGLVPYFVGTGFPWGQIESTHDWWVGYALEGGFAFLLAPYIDMPIYISASVKWQTVSIEDPVPLFNEIAPGADKLLPAKEDYIAGFFGVYYRFSL